MRNLIANTPRGAVSFAYEGFSEKPVALVIHGFMRRAEPLFSWADRLPGYSVCFARLPGHMADHIDGGLPAWIDAFTSAIRGFPKLPELVIGESLGAVVALGLPVPNIVAVEPFITTGKLWAVHANVHEVIARSNPLWPVYVEMFVNREYSSLLQTLTSRTLVLAGDEPMMPRRPCEYAPSILDDEDFARFASHPMIEARRVPGGHDLLLRSADACLAQLQPFLPTTR